MKEYRYLCCCGDLKDREDIDGLLFMVENAKKVQYRTVLKHCHGLVAWAHSLGYARSRPGLILKRDPLVGFFKSTFLGQTCYFVDWSAIEFVWVRSGQCRDRVQATSVACKSVEIPLRTRLINGGPNEARRVVAG